MSMKVGTKLIVWDHSNYEEHQASGSGGWERIGNPYFHVGGELFDQFIFGGGGRGDFGWAPRTSFEPHFSNLAKQNPKKSFRTPKVRSLEKIDQPKAEAWCNPLDWGK